MIYILLTAVRQFTNILQRHRSFLQLAHVSYLVWNAKRVNGVLKARGDNVEIYRDDLWTYAIDVKTYDTEVKIYDNHLKI